MAAVCHIAPDSLFTITPQVLLNELIICYSEDDFLLLKLFLFINCYYINQYKDEITNSLYLKGFSITIKHFIYQFNGYVSLLLTLYIIYIYIYGTGFWSCK